MHFMYNLKNINIKKIAKKKFFFPNVIKHLLPPPFRFTTLFFETKTIHQTAKAGVRKKEKV